MESMNMNWLVGLLGAVVSIVVARWTYLAQQSDAKNTREAIRALREEAEKQQEATKELIHAMDRVMTLHIATGKRFLEVKELIRKSVVLLCILVSILAFVLALIP